MLDTISDRLKVHSGGIMSLPPPPPWLVRTFVQRTVPWEFLENNLGRSHDRGMFTITGGPGYGKSQVILNFVEDLKRRRDPEPR